MEINNVSTKGLYHLLFSLNAAKFFAVDYDLNNPLSVSGFSDEELLLASDINRTLVALDEVCTTDYALMEIADLARVIKEHTSGRVPLDKMSEELKLYTLDGEAFDVATNVYCNICQNHKYNFGVQALCQVYVSFLLKDITPILFYRNEYSVDSFLTVVSCIGELRRLSRDARERLQALADV